MKHGFYHLLSPKLGFFQISPGSFITSVSKINVSSNIIINKNIAIFPKTIRKMDFGRYLYITSIDHIQHAGFSALSSKSLADLVTDSSSSSPQLSTLPLASRASI